MKLQGQAVKHVTIKAQLLFGYERFGEVVVSDKEKTIIEARNGFELVAARISGNT
jgi:hypothetical protein